MLSLHTLQAVQTVCQSTIIAKCFTHTVEIFTCDYKFFSYSFKLFSSFSVYIAAGGIRLAALMMQ